jgi:hypothetical protein
MVRTIATLALCVWMSSTGSAADRPWGDGGDSAGDGPRHRTRCGARDPRIRAIVPALADALATGIRESLLQVQRATR